MAHKTSSSIRRFRKKHLLLESLETRDLLAAVFVNDNWSLSSDLGATGLTAGDQVSDSFDGGSNAAVYGTTAFGTVVTATDDFNDGNDTADPAWNRFDPFGAAAPASFSFPGGNQYRIQAANSPSPGTFGPGRAGGFIEGDVHDFEVSVDITGHTFSLGQTFGIVARATQVGAGTTDGYILAYDTPGDDLNIVAIADEVPDTLAFVDVGDLSNAFDYRMVFRGVGQTLTGEIYQLPNLNTPIETVSINNSLHSQGQAGVFTSVLTGDGSGTSDVTFDNVSIATSLPNNDEIADAVTAASPGDSLFILDGTYPGAATINKSLEVEIGDAAGTVEVQSLTLSANAFLNIDLFGETAGEFDVITTDSVNLSNATLQLNRQVAAGPPTEFVIINNTGGSPVSGTFSNGNSITVDGQTFTISYNGGDGNDVVLIPQTTTITVDVLKDNTIFSEDELSNGSGQHLFAGRTDIRTSANRRALIAFDLSAIPAFSNVYDSRVTLHVNKTPGGSPTVAVELHKSDSEWGESTSDAPFNEGQGTAAAVGDATWLHSSFNTVTWDAPGGDFSAAASASTSVAGIADYDWTGGTLNADVQSWLHGAPNTGWFLVGDESQLRTAKRFTSSEGAANDRPSLTIDYVPPVVTPKVETAAINLLQIDPPDLATGPQPTSWVQQRSDLRSVVIDFSEPMATISPADIVLTNLGIDAPADPDTIVPVTAGQLNQSGNTLSITFPPESLAEGAYSLEILPTVTNLDGTPLDGNGDGTTGDSYVLLADSVNQFHKLTFNFNGDTGVSVFDFTTFSYWFGLRVGPAGAPEYANVNGDEGISVFDFTFFSDNFGVGITLPVAFASPVTANNFGVSTESGLARVDGELDDEAQDVIAQQPLQRWEPDLQQSQRSKLKLQSPDGELAQLLDVLAKDVASVLG